METTFVEKVFGFEFKFEVLDEAQKTVSIALANKQTMSTSLIVPAKVTHNEVEYTVTEIAEGAFEAAILITSAVISDGIKTIKTRAFDKCLRLEKISIADSVTKIEALAFTYCKFKKFAFPSGVTEIPTFTLAMCKELTTITIPNSVQVIANFAFSSCSKLSKITIDNSALNISVSSRLVQDAKQKIKITYLQ